MYSTMGKSQLNIRINDDLADAVAKRTESTGRTKTDIVREALASYLNISTDKSDLDIIDERLSVLETKFEALQSTKGQKTANNQQKDKSVVNVDDLGELVTRSEASALTDYSESTLSSKFSRLNIEAVDRVNGNRAGLYSKNEILDKIGTK